MHFQTTHAIPWSQVFAVFKVLSAKGMPFSSQQVLLTKQNKERKLLGEPAFPSVPAGRGLALRCLLTFQWWAFLRVSRPPAGPQLPLSSPAPSCSAALTDFRKACRPPPTDLGLNSQFDRVESTHILLHWVCFKGEKDSMTADRVNPASEYGRRDGWLPLKNTHQDDARGPRNSSCTFGATWIPVSPTA